MGVDDVVSLGSHLPDSLQPELCVEGGLMTARLDLEVLPSGTGIVRRRSRQETNLPL
jgi:hypothetical protein